MKKTKEQLRRELEIAEGTIKDTENDKSSIVAPLKSKLELFKRGFELSKQGSLSSHQ